MFGLFKKKVKKKSPPVLADVDGNALGAGDQVLSLRYDLGECTLMESETGLIYKSKDSGEQVSWVKMIDASTERQKVKKILDQS
jgi:hypothetical protein